MSTPDPDLNAAIREALQKPIGPLTEEELLNLTVLNACCRNVRGLQGLETARNLATLYVMFNQLTNVSIASGLTKLTTLDLSFNPLTNFFLPTGLTNLTSLKLEVNQLTSLKLPAEETWSSSQSPTRGRGVIASLPAGTFAIGKISARMTVGWQASEALVGCIPPVSRACYGTSGRAAQKRPLLRNRVTAAVTSFRHIIQVCEW